MSFEELAYIMKFVDTQKSLADIELEKLVYVEEIP